MSTIHSTKELRAFLVDQMHGVSNDEVTPEKAKGITNIAQQIYNTLAIEVRIAKANFDMGTTSVPSVEFDDN